VLEGSVRRAGNNLRITAQLIDGVTDAHLWAEKYGGTLDDVFDLQEKLSRQIVASLRVALTPDEDRRLSARPLADVRALEYYLRAMQQIRTFTEAGLDQALDLTNRALGLVGERALLHATQALIHWQYRNAGIKLDEDTLRTADACADRALELDGESSAGFLAKGLVAYTRGHLPDAASHLKRAAQLDGSSDALAFLSYVSALADRPESARAYADQAIASDPLNPWALWARGMCELVSGDLATAVDRFRAGAALAPDDALVLFFHAVTLAHAGQKAEALAQFEECAVRLPAYASWTSMWTGALRDERETVCAAAADLEAYAERDKEVSWHSADCLAAVGETDQALRWLAASIELGSVNHRFFSTRDPFLAPLRGDPRFAVLMERAQEKQRGIVV
jgi:tetratricopeptide (TPR) repeat protein